MNNNDFFNDQDDELFNAYEGPDADLKFRSVKVESGISHEPHFYHDSRPTGSDFLLETQFFKKVKEAAASNGNVCPSLPFGMSKTNFSMTNTDCGSVIQSVTNYLSGLTEHDFSFIKDDFMWKGKFLQGSASYEFDINLYHQRGSENYTVVVTKMKSDCAPNGGFFDFFAAFKTALATPTAGDVESAAAPARRRPGPPPSFSFGTPACVLSDEDFLSGIQPVFKMAHGCIESRVQSAKMLCDVSQKSAHYLELPAFRAACITTLKAMVTDENLEVRQHAVMAIAAFTTLPSYQLPMICSCILPVLFGLVQDCANPEHHYDTAHKRRTAGTILALLSAAQPVAVREELLQQQCDLFGWQQRAQGLSDLRMREAALQVQANLSSSATTTTSSSSGKSASDGSMGSPYGGGGGVGSIPGSVFAVKSVGAGASSASSTSSVARWDC